MGFLLATRISPTMAHVAQVAVDPEQQGRGLGNALLARHLEGATAAGLASSLLVTRDNHVAVGSTCVVADHTCLNVDLPLHRGIVHRIAEGSNIHCSSSHGHMIDCRREDM